MNALDALIRELEQDRSLDEPGRLRRRIDALDRIEALQPHAQSAVDDSESTTGVLLRERAHSMCDRLEAINDAFYLSLRSEIQRGVTPKWLLDQVAVRRGEGAATGARNEGYDYRDVVAAGILQFEEPAAGIAELATEMVFYQPTPVRHIFDLIGRAALTDRDVLVDLGSGLGHVSLLVSICTQARSIGIEREAAYVECARRCASALNVARVTFIQQDARDADFSSGTLFYLYTPFTGAILRDVLDSLRREALGRDIRIGAYGPCTAILAEEPWLVVEDTWRAGRPALFRSLG